MSLKPDIIQTGLVMDSQYWLHAAQAAVRAYCGWHIAPKIDDVLTADAEGGRTLLVPSKKINSVSSITLDGQELLGRCDWSEDGIIQLRSGRWPDRLQAVSITLNHGYDPQEVAHIQQLIMHIARRARSQPAVQSQSVNGSSMTAWGTGGNPLGIPLLDTEKAMLDTYRLNWSPR